MLAPLVVLFTLVPLIELALLIYVGQWMGVWTTIGLVIGTGILGAWLAKLQGLLVLRQLRRELSERRLPTAALVDGALVLLAGAILITPGLLTDLSGFALLVPSVRAVVRRRLIDAFRKRIQAGKATVIDVS